MDDGERRVPELPYRRLLSRIEEDPHAERQPELIFDAGVERSQTRLHLIGVVALELDKQDRPTPIEDKPSVIAVLGPHELDESAVDDLEPARP